MSEIGTFDSRFSSIYLTTVVNYNDFFVNEANRFGVLYATEIATNKAIII